MPSGLRVTLLVPLAIRMSQRKATWRAFLAELQSTPEYAAWAERHHSLPFRGGKMDPETSRALFDRAHGR